MGGKPDHEVRRAMVILDLIDVELHGPREPVVVSQIFRLAPVNHIRGSRRADRADAIRVRMRHGNSRLLETPPVGAIFTALLIPECQVL